MGRNRWHTQIALTSAQLAVLPPPLAMELMLQGEQRKTLGGKFWLANGEVASRTWRWILYDRKRWLDIVGRYSPPDVSARPRVGRVLLPGSASLT